MTGDVHTTDAEATAGERRKAFGTTGALIALAVVVYAPILYYMVLHWKAVDDYSHGFLIVPLALFFAWERRPQLHRAVIEPSWWGVVPLFLGTLTLTIGRLGVELVNMRVSFVFTLTGLVLLLLGKQVSRILAFPLLFLFLMVPLPQSLVNVVAFPLQLIAADAATGVLYLLKIPSLREGNIIHLASTQLFVEQACSGLRSLMALVTLGVIFAYFFRKTPAERLIIVASAIPIAILVNTFRVALSGILTHHIGKEAARGWIHQTEGMFTFAIAMVLMLTEAWILRKIWPRRWRATSSRGEAQA
jgi:exosortase